MIMIPGRVLECISASDNCAVSNEDIKPSPGNLRIHKRGGFLALAEEGVSKQLGEAELVARLGAAVAEVAVEVSGLYLEAGDVDHGAVLFIPVEVGFLVDKPQVFNGRTGFFF